MMTKVQTVQPGGWAAPRGYANGTIGSGRMLFVAGQVGWDPTQPEPTFPASFAEQFEQALSNVRAVMSSAGATADQLAKLTIYVTDKREYLASLKEVGASWRKHFGRHYPAMALIEVKGLLSDEAKVEMEGIAVF